MESYKNLITFFRHADTPALYKALMAGAGILLAWLFLWWLTRLLDRRLAGKYPFFRANHDAIKGLRQLITCLFCYLAATYLVNLFDVPFLTRLIHAALLMIAAWPLKNVSHAVLSFLRNNVAHKTETRFDDIVFDLLFKLIDVIIFIIATLLALDFLGLNIMPFLAGAGVAGIAIGFAAKDTLSNLIAGVLLIIDRPFEIGDRIELWQAPPNSSSWGDVIEIGLRATKIKTTDNIIIIIPNNQIMTRDIINYTTLEGIIRVRINVDVAYQTDIERAKALILEVARSAEWVLSSPAPKVVARNFGESAVQLQLRVWIQDARKRMDTISEVTDRIKTRFDQEKIQIPFTRRDIRIITDDEVSTENKTDELA